MAAVKVSVRKRHGDIAHRSDNRSHRGHRDTTTRLADSALIASAQAGNAARRQHRRPVAPRSRAAPRLSPLLVHPPGAHVVGVLRHPRQTVRYRALRSAYTSAYMVALRCGGRCAGGVSSARAASASASATKLRHVCSASLLQRVDHCCGDHRRHADVGSNETPVNMRRQHADGHPAQLACAGSGLLEHYRSAAPPSAPQAMPPPPPLRPRCHPRDVLMRMALGFIAAMRPASEQLVRTVEQRHMQVDALSAPAVTSFQRSRLYRRFLPRRMRCWQRRVGRAISRTPRQRARRVVNRADRAKADQFP